MYMLEKGKLSLKIVFFYGLQIFANISLILTPSFLIMPL